MRVTSCDNTCRKRCPSASPTRLRPYLKWEKNGLWHGFMSQNRAHFHESLETFEAMSPKTSQAHVINYASRQAPCTIVHSVFTAVLVQQRSAAGGNTRAVRPPKTGIVGLPFTARDPSNNRSRSILTTGRDSIASSPMSHNTWLARCRHPWKFSWSAWDFMVVYGRTMAGKEGSATSSTKLAHWMCLSCCCLVDWGWLVAGVGAGGG